MRKYGVDSARSVVSQLCNSCRWITGDGYDCVQGEKRGIPGKEVCT